ncbi:MAG: hypothetical protein HeimC3_13430 [Candidatus Heimdallarchaeota archaeon LC_3]|nr:MAG: hypothetical protein HeimC3_13430 [Candidatus Heimdallarchaeota archaeon LC_3]
MSDAPQQKEANKEHTSSDILDILNKKFFGSLIENSGVVYGTGELGTIPDIFPMLLITVKDYLSRLDPQERKIEIEPGLGVTLEKLGHNMSGISPSAFILLNSKLRHGSYMVGCFTPVKTSVINFYGTKNLLEWIADEIDELLDDMESSVDPLTWRDVKYDVITQLVNERAQLINFGLNSPTLHSTLLDKISYVPENMLLADCDLNFSNIPLFPKVSPSNIKFWAKNRGEAPEFLNITRAVLNASFEPLRQLNRDSLTAEDRNELEQYYDKLKELPKGKKIKDIYGWINNLRIGLPNDDYLVELSERFMGTIVTPLVVDYYCTNIKKNLEKSAILDMSILDDFSDFATVWLIRRYCLGIISKKNYVEEIFSTMLEIYREYQIKLSSLDKQEINNAIISFDQQISDHIERTNELDVDIIEEQIKEYYDYWMEEFSGIIPEEITLILNIGILNIFIDYQKRKIFAIFSLAMEKSEQDIDVASIREIANKAIDNNSLPKM